MVAIALALLDQLAQDTRTAAVSSMSLCFLSSP